MSEQGTSKTSPMMILAAIVGAFVAPVVAIALIVQLVLSIQASQVDKDDPKMADAAVKERIKPYVQMKAIDPTLPRVERQGEEVYKEVCSSCHGIGALGAPRFGNKPDWAPRIAKGYDSLLTNAVNGLKSMPPRGGDPDISDIEMNRTMVYMANAVGAGFKVNEKAVAKAPDAKK
jgi:cytochrome c5